MIWNSYELDQIITQLSDEVPCLVKRTDIIKDVNPDGNLVPDHAPIYEPRMLAWSIKVVVNPKLWTVLLGILSIEHQHLDWDCIHSRLSIVLNIVAEYLGVRTNLDEVLIPAWAIYGQDTVLIEEVEVFLVEYCFGLPDIHHSAGGNEANHICVLLVELWHLCHRVLEHGGSL